MKLTHFFIEHPRFAAVLNIFAVLIGLATMVALPVAQYPNIVPPTIQITASYPGASAETIARTVATRSNRRSTALKTWITSVVSRPATAF